MIPSATPRFDVTPAKALKTCKSPQAILGCFQLGGKIQKKCLYQASSLKSRREQGHVCKNRKQRPKPFAVYRGLDYPSRSIYTSFTIAVLSLSTNPIEWNVTSVLITVHMGSFTALFLPGGLRRRCLLCTSAQIGDVPPASPVATRSLVFLRTIRIYGFCVGLEIQIYIYIFFI